MKLIFILLLFFIVACTNKQDNKIKFSQEEIAVLELDATHKVSVQEDDALIVDLNPFLKKQSYNLGEIIKTIDITPLETTDESILSSIEDIIITDSNIYIKDEYKGGELVIFDRQGNFIKRIEKGQGPGEILPSLNNIAFDIENNELIVFNNHFFSFFTPDGQYKRRERIPLNAYSFAITPNGYLFHSLNGLNNRHIDPNSEYQILVTDKKYKLISVGFPYAYSKNNFYEGKTRYIATNKDDVAFTFKFTNSVYQYIDDYNINLKYKLDISKKEIPGKLLQESYDVLMSELENNDYSFYMGDYVENPSHDYFKLTNLHTRQYIDIYRNKQTGNCIGGVGRIVDRTLYVPLNEPISSFNKYFVSCFFPADNYMDLLTSKVLSDDIVKKLKSLSEDDNPVLVFYELKEF